MIESGAHLESDRVRSYLLLRHREYPRDGAVVQVPVGAGLMTIDDETKIRHRGQSECCWVTQRLRGDSVAASAGASWSWSLTEI